MKKLIIFLFNTFVLKFFLYKNPSSKLVRKTDLEVLEKTGFNITSIMNNYRIYCDEIAYKANQVYDLKTEAKENLTQIEKLGNTITDLESEHSKKMQEMTSALRTAQGKDPDNLPPFGMVMNGEVHTPQRILLEDFPTYREVLKALSPIFTDLDLQNLTMAKVSDALFNINITDLETLYKLSCRLKDDYPINRKELTLDHVVNLIDATFFLNKSFKHLPSLSQIIQMTQQAIIQNSLGKNNSMFSATDQDLK